MDQTLEKTAEKELKEELKRNKPKDVRKLYDMLVKSAGSSDAYTFMLNLLSGCYTLMPNGRYRLDHKKYSDEVGRQLKQQKENKIPQLNPRPEKKSSANNYGGLDELLNAAAEEDSFRRTPMSDFAVQTGILMMNDREAQAAELYRLNKDLFFGELGERIASFDHRPLTFEELEGNEYKGYYYLNLFDDIDLALKNTVIHDPSFLSVQEEYLKTLLNEPLDWSDCIGNSHNLRESLYENLCRQNKKDEAEQFVRTWKEQYPDSTAPEHAVLWQMWMDRKKNGLKEGTELSDRILGEKESFAVDDRGVLEIMAMIYEEDGNLQKLQLCKELIRKVRV